jgi:hypothetical protein
MKGLSGSTRQRLVTIATNTIMVVKVTKVTVAIKAAMSNIARLLDFI